MSQTYNKNRQTRVLAQPRAMTPVAQVVRTRPLSETHEPVVIFSREMLQTQQYAMQV